MKTIPEPKLTGATLLSAAEMNKIHFGGKNSTIDVVPKKSGAGNQ